MSRSACRGAVSAALGLVVLLGVAIPPAGAAASARDRAILGAGVIRRSDVPAGWTSQKQNGGSGPRYTRTAACKSLATVVNGAARTVPHRLSPDFSDPAVATQTTLAANAAYAFKDVTAAGGYLDAYRAAGVPACFAQALLRALKGSLQGGSPTVNVAPLTNLAGLGDDEVGYSVALTVSAQGQRETLYEDIIEVRVGRAVLGFNFQNLGVEFPSAAAIIRPAASRVAPLAT